MGNSSTPDAPPRTVADALKDKCISLADFSLALHHPFAAALAERVWVHPEGSEISLDEEVLGAVEAGLIHLAGQGDAFFEAYRQVMNLCFHLRSLYPDSMGPLVLMQMLERVAQASLPLIENEEVERSHARLGDVASRFKSFIGGGPEEQEHALPDNGERLDTSRLKGPIRG